MGIKEYLGFLHPALAVAIVFPLLGMVVNLAWQTRQRRLQTEHREKSKISPTAGSEHVQLGKWLAATVIGVALIGLAYAIATKMIDNNVWAEEPGRVIFVALMFALTLATFAFLYQAKTKLWRGVFATLTGMGLIIIGCQPEVFRRGFEWYTSHYYYGVSAALLMIFSLAIIPDIYKDKQKRWRRAHTFLNIIAVLLFLGQGYTGSRDLYEIGLYTPPPGLLTHFLW